jgi:peptidoglycan/xylan/chitin deacetylase (PgdA/CDA1 family)
VRDPVFILNFHGLGSRPPGLSAGEAECWLDQSFFEAILDLVRERKDVLITVDDSNESDYTIALPALQARNLRARFFAVAQRLDQMGYLSTTQLQALAAAGMAIGSHGLRHRRWAGLNEEDLHEELVEARQRLEQVVGRPVREAACPFGAYDRHVLRALRHLGYERIYTSDEGPTFDGLWTQPRNTIRLTHDLAYIQRITSGTPAGFQKLLRDIKLKLKQWR